MHMTTLLMLLSGILGLCSFLMYVHNKDTKLITILKPKVKSKKLNLVKMTLKKDPDIFLMSYVIAGMYIGFGIFVLSVILALMGVP